MVLRGTEQSVTFQIKASALEEMSEVEDPIAATLQHLDLVVESLDEAAAVGAEEVIGDPIPMLMERAEKALEAGDGLGANQLAPHS